MGGELSSMFDCTSARNNTPSANEWWQIELPSWGGKGSGGAEVLGLAKPLDSGASLADVARCLDLDKLRSSWERFAGPDDSMDWEEYQLFMKAVGLPDEHAANMWKIMDSDKSGQVDADEVCELAPPLACPDPGHNRTCDLGSTHAWACHLCSPHTVQLCSHLDDWGACLASLLPRLPLREHVRLLHASGRLPQVQQLPVLPRALG